MRVRVCVCVFALIFAFRLDGSKQLAAVVKGGKRKVLSSASFQAVRVQADQAGFPAEEEEDRAAFRVQL